ncbi:hypothetical protein FACS189494_03070 [Spirochaetia bacterium]|nr:hypothetical protein FACS189494_03070 [Spirochaetia bacterium]
MTGKNVLKSNKFPVILPVFTKLKLINKAPRISVPELYKLIKIDPVLTALTLNLYNKFYPKDSKKFQGIAKIIIVLNSNTVKNFLFDSVHSNDDENSKKQIDFWLRSAAGVAASNLLCEIRGIKSEKTEEYRAAALLRNFADYPVACSFGFPESINDVILNYKSCADYSGGYKDLVSNTALVDYIVDKYVFNKNKTKELDKNIFETLKVEKNILEKVKPELIKGINTYTNFIDLKVSL